MTIQIYMIVLFKIYNCLSLRKRNYVLQIRLCSVTTIFMCLSLATFLSNSLKRMVL